MTGATRQIVTGCTVHSPSSHVATAAELAAEFGREAEYAKARWLAKDGALDAHTRRTGALGRITGDDYPL